MLSILDLWLAHEYVALFIILFSCDVLVFHILLNIKSNAPQDDDDLEEVNFEVFEDSDFEEVDLEIAEDSDSGFEEFQSSESEEEPEEDLAL